MTLFALDPGELGRTAGWQLAAAVVLGTLGVYLLLPRPRGRVVSLGVFCCLGAAVVLAAYLLNTFGEPTRDKVASVLFWLFAGGAVTFGTALVTQRNPARGAMAFAFVILSTCGLFLLLAAPFLMAATIIIYAGAIIVTFLFVLMLSHAGGPSDENDRTREPLLGSLAGFGFAGLVLFALYLGSPAAATDAPPYPLPAVAITADSRDALAAAATDLQRAIDATDAKEVEAAARNAIGRVAEVVGPAANEPPVDVRSRPTVQDRLRTAETDPRAAAIRGQAAKLAERKKAASDKLDNALVGKADLAPVKAELTALRDEVLLLRGRGELPARNVAALGYSLYSEHLIAVEMAGTLLLVATIGAVAIAGRKGARA
ncbi:MAG: NADH-quinone oxidoreductase subunit J [Gemmataceae bacterium]